MQTKRLSSTSLKGVKAAPSFDDKKTKNCHVMSLEHLYQKSYYNSLNLYSFKGLINMFKETLAHIRSAGEISQGPPVRLFDQDYTYFC